MKIFTFVALVSIYLLSECVNCYIDSSYSLPNSIKPVRYNLTMEPNLNITHDSTSTFNGSVIIEIVALESTNTITLHLKDLAVNEESLKLISSNGSEISILFTLHDKDRQFYILHLQYNLSENVTYTLIIDDFYGNLNYDNIGFYLAKYYDTETNRSKYLALSDFEPSDARKAFPCFDAPNMKAKFIINLIRPINFISLSNEKLIATEALGRDRYKDTFRETVIMPTYVLAFIVCDFKSTLQLERHRIFANSAAIHRGALNFALLEGVTILETLEKFTGINYSLSKMDQVAIPNKYFQEEAMENWGLVTFSEKHLFITNETSKTEDIQRCVTYISHEFSHQWFGNLVTFNEWRYIWLSEGFASFFQYYITSLVKPSWRMMDQFIIEVLQKILERDTHNTSPMNFQPREIGKIPNPLICYLKASTVIRMTQHFLTESVFQKGLMIYLKKNIYQSVDPSVLFEAYQEAVDKSNCNKLLGNNTVTSILNTWTTNAGFPLITVTRNYETGSVTINQTRYFENNFYEDSTIWFVPINYVLQSDVNYNFEDTTAKLWLTNKSVTLNFSLNTNEWLLLNKQITGYYRVNYDNTNWERLALYLNSDNYIKIHPANRAQLLHEAFHFAVYNYIPFSIPLNITKYLIRETDYVAIRSFIDVLEWDQINSLLISSNVYNIFKSYVINILSTASNRLGFDEKEEDTNLDKLNRIEILKLMCKFGHSNSTNNALIKLGEWKRTGKLSLPPNLKYEVLCCAMITASLEDWDWVFNTIQTYSTSERHLHYNAIECSENPEILNRLFDTFSNFNSSAHYPRRSALYRIVSTTTGRDTAIKYIKNYSGNLPPEFLFIVCTQITNQEQLAEMNVRDKVSEHFYQRLVRLVEGNSRTVNLKQQIQIEEWFSHVNYV